MSRLLLGFTLLVVLTLPSEARGQTGEKVESAYVIKLGAAGLSSEVMKIVAEQLHPTLPNWPQANSPYTSVQIGFTGERLNDDAPLMTLTVSVLSEAHRPSKEELRKLWNVAREELQAQLRRLELVAQDTKEDRLRRQIDQAEAEQRQLENISTRLTNTLIQERAKSAGADGEVLAKALTEAAGKQRELQLREAGGRARREAIEKRIDELISQEPQSDAAQAVLSESEKLVDIRRRQLAVVTEMHDTGSRTALEVAEAEAELSSAIIDLNKARLEAIGGELRVLNNELSKLLIEAAEIHGHHEALEQIVAELREQQQETARAAVETGSLESRLNDARHRLAQIQANLANLRGDLDRLDQPEITLRPLAMVAVASEDSEPEASAPGDAEAENDK